MGVFYVLLFIPLIIQHVAVRSFYIGYEKRNRGSLAFFFFLLTALIMFRHENIGNDTINYIYYFNKFANMNWNELSESSIEIGFSSFNKLVSLVSRNSHFYLALTALIISGLIYPTYKRLCVDSSLTIVLFCTMSTFVMMFSGIRQMIAIGIGFVAYEFTRNNKIIPFLATVCIATAFHASGFMIIFMYPLYHVRVTKTLLYMLVPVLAGILLFNKPIFFVLSLIMEQYTKYDGTVSSTGAYSMLLLFIIFTVFAFVIPEESSLDRETLGLRNFLLMALTLQMFAPLHTLAMRMNYYYIIFIPLLIPKIIEYRGERWKQVAMAGRHIMVVFFLIYFFANAYSASNLSVFPYHFFWENV